jgi:HAD superfamily hydrolase (TIGR01490 family)
LRDIDIVFYDMDHTLIDNDCDVSWKEFLIDHGLAPANERVEAQRHWEEFVQGRLDEQIFLAFQMRQFVGKTPDEMMELSRLHFEERVKPRMYPQAIERIDRAREAGRRQVMLSATNAIVCAPVAEAFGLNDVICTQLETRDGRFTGRIVEPYCSREGKIHYAGAYCREKGFSFDRAAYYGDSVYDIPMLERVARAFAVNPGDKLRERAQSGGWTIERWTLNGKG